MAEPDTITCPNCKAVRLSEDGACPDCGAKLIHLRLTATVGCHVRVEGKQFRPGARARKDNPAIVEFISGDDLFRKTAEWRNLWRLIDRLRNWYTKIVTDKKTGAVIYRRDEPLDQHRQG